MPYSHLLSSLDDADRGKSDRGRIGRRIRSVVAMTVAAVAVAVVPGVVSGGPRAVASGRTQEAVSLAREIPAGQPVPATRETPHVTQGILPPGNPPANIAPSPDFFDSCSGMAYDDSQGCVNATVAAIDNARAQEGLPGMALPVNWYQLTPQQQLFVATNLERTVRGLPPLVAMSNALDQASAVGAADGSDPVPPAGFPWSLWGSNWGGAIGNPLETIYLWMYDDGPGAVNVACPQAGAPGCWGHRDVILMSVHCPWGTPSLTVGAAFAPTRSGGASWAALVVGRCPTQ